MFDWFWKALYGISKVVFEIVDALISIAFKLAGIESVVYDGEETDFLTYIISSDDVQFAYMAIAIIGFVILVVFTIIAIVRSIAKSGEMDVQSPRQICIRAFKSVLMFMFVPGMLLMFNYFITIVMKQVYLATSYNASSLGSYLFTIFARDAGLSDSGKTFFLTEVDSDGDPWYQTTSKVMEYINLSDFDFIFSWVVGGVLIVNLSSVLIQFVSRAIEIVIIFLASPFCMGASVLDEGARLKTWRDQLISKYLGAFGAIIAINIYCLVISAVVDAKFEFFSNGFLNDVSKIMIILGGGHTMKKSMATVAALVSQTAAADQRDPAFAGNAFGGALKKAFGVTPVGLAGKFVGGAISGGVKSKWEEGQKALAGKLGLGSRGGGPGGGAATTKEGSSENKNDNNPEGYNDKEKLNEALESDESSDKGGGDNSNQNNNSPNGGQGNQLLNNAMQGGEEDKKDNKEGGE